MAALIYGKAGFYGVTVAPDVVLNLMIVAFPVMQARGPQRATAVATRGTAGCHDECCGCRARHRRL